MNKYDEIVNHLAEAQRFDAAAFIGDTTWPQELCDLMLALAVVFDDFKDVLTAHVILNSVPPAGVYEKTAPWGHHAGISTHILRLQSGLVYELLELLRQNGEIVNSPAFRVVVSHLAPTQRTAWEGLEDVAMRRASMKEFATALKDIRNAAGYHYDSTKIGSAYRELFNGAEAPMISKGENLPSSRFYFADAAAQKAMNDAVENLTGDASAKKQEAGKLVKTFLSGDSELLRQIHQALFHLVVYFIQTRGFPLSSSEKKQGS